MTTSVTITCHGPQNVKVEKVEMAGATTLLASLLPDESSTQPVYGGMCLRITEIPKDDT